MGENPVALECAGPQGSFRRGKERPTLWILWRWERGEWWEIARAQALNWAWAVILREPAILALRPTSSDPTMADPTRRGREVTEELWRAIDASLIPELPEVRTFVLTSIYDRVAGRIVLA